MAGLDVAAGEHPLAAGEVQAALELVRVVAVAGKALRLEQGEDRDREDPLAVDPWGGGGRRIVRERPARCRPRRDEGRRDAREDEHLPE